MNGKKGIIGTLISGITILIVIGLFLATLDHFDGDLVAMLKWILNLSWTIVVAVRDTTTEWVFK